MATKPQGFAKFSRKSERNYTVDDILLENQAQEIARELAALKGKQPQLPGNVANFQSGANISVYVPANSNAYIRGTFTPNHENTFARGSFDSPSISSTLVLSFFRESLNSWICAIGNGEDSARNINVTFFVVSTNSGTAGVANA